MDLGIYRNLATLKERELLRSRFRKIKIQWMKLEGLVTVEELTRILQLLFSAASSIARNAFLITNTYNQTTLSKNYNETMKIESTNEFF